jgi:hypothetical protein
MWVGCTNFRTEMGVVGYHVVISSELPHVIPTREERQAALPHDHLILFTIASSS